VRSGALSVQRLSLAAALGAALLSMGARAQDAGVTEPPPAAAGDLWSHRCSACHGADGSGPAHKRPGVHLPDFRSAAWQARHADDELRTTILDGIPAKRMPSFKSRLTAGQIDALVQHVRGFAKITANP